MTVASSRALVPLGILLAAWLLFTLPGGFRGLELLAGLTALAAGMVGAAVWPRAAAGARQIVRIAEDLLGEGAADPAPPPGRADAGDPDRLDAATGQAATDALLGTLARDLAATRLVIWDVDDRARRIAPAYVYGDPVRPRPAAGSPLVWALEEQAPLRLDPVPRWAHGAVTAAPVDDRRVLTVETPVGGAAAPDAAARAAHLLGPFLALRDREADALAATARLDRVVELLRTAPRQTDPARMPEALAGAALDLTGAAGALVASWTGEGGHVLVRMGQGGGPRPGTPFRIAEGDLAHAARTGATVARAPDGTPRPDLAAPDERWERPAPPFRTAIPLLDPGGRPQGVIAVWGDRPPAEQGVTLVEALGPLFALQLAQASDLARFRTRATRDPLTGLPNRAALDDRLEDEVARFHRYRRPLASMVIDLDHFKRINDTHGHDAGDRVLRRVGEVIRHTIRDADFPARFGGEELVVLMPETMLRPALEVAERVRAAIESTSIHVDQGTIPVTASVGVSACPECVDDPASLFTSADEALYISKDEGRNRVTAAGTRLPGGHPDERPVGG